MSESSKEIVRGRGRHAADCAWVTQRYQCDCGRPFPSQYAHMCRDGHDEIGFNDPEDKYSERCPACSEIDRLVDGVRDHLISLGVPADRIDGAGCDSGDPLDFMQAEITQAFSYFEDQRSAPRSRSKKQKIEDDLRRSDLTAQLAERDNIEYGHHETLPRGEHVANARKR